MQGSVSHTVLSYVADMTLPARPDAGDIAAAAKAARAVRVRLAKEYGRVDTLAKAVLSNYEEAAEDELDDDDETHHHNNHEARAAMLGSMGSPDALLRREYLQLSDLDLAGAVVVPAVLKHGAHHPELLAELLRVLVGLSLPPLEGSRGLTRQHDGVRKTRDAVATDHFFEVLVHSLAPVAQARAEGRPLSPGEIVLVETVLLLCSNLLKGAPLAVETVVGCLCRTHGVELMLVMLQQNHERIQALLGEHDQSTTPARSSLAPSADPQARASASASRFTAELQAVAQDVALPFPRDENEAPSVLLGALTPSKARRPASDVPLSPHGPASPIRLTKPAPLSPHRAASASASASVSHPAPTPLHPMPPSSRASPMPMTPRGASQGELVADPTLPLPPTLEATLAPALATQPPQATPAEEEAPFPTMPPLDGAAGTLDPELGLLEAVTQDPPAPEPEEEQAEEEQEEEAEDEAEEDEEGDELVIDGLATQTMLERMVERRGEPLDVVRRWNLAILEIVALCFRTAPAAVIATAGVESATQRVIAQRFHGAAQETQRWRAAVGRRLGATQSGALLVRREHGRTGTSDVLGDVPASLAKGSFTAVGNVAGQTRSPMEEALELDRRKRERLNRRLLQPVGRRTLMPLPTQELLAAQYRQFARYGFGHLSRMVWPGLLKRIREADDAVREDKEATAARAAALTRDGPLISALDGTELGDVHNYALLATTMMRFARAALRFKDTQLTAQAAARQLGVDIPDETAAVTEAAEAAMPLAMELLTESHLGAALELLAALHGSAALAKAHDWTNAADFVAELFRLLVHVVDGDVSDAPQVAMVASGLAAATVHNEQRIRIVLAQATRVKHREASPRVLEVVVRLIHATLLLLDRVSFGGAVLMGKRKAKARKPKAKAAVDDAASASGDESIGSDEDAAIAAEEAAAGFLAGDADADDEDGQRTPPQATAAGGVPPREASVASESEDDDLPATGGAEEAAVGQDREAHVTDFVCELCTPARIQFLLQSLRLWRQLPDDALDATAALVDRVMETYATRRALFTLPALVAASDVLRNVDECGSAALVLSCRALSAAFFDMSDVLEMQLRCVRSLFTLPPHFSRELEETGMDETVALQRAEAQDHALAATTREAAKERKRMRKGGDLALALERQRQNFGAVPDMDMDGGDDLYVPGGGGGDGGAMTFAEDEDEAVLRGYAVPTAAPAKPARTASPKKKERKDKKVKGKKERRAKRVRSDDEADDGDDPAGEGWAHRTRRAERKLKAKEERRARKAAKKERKAQRRAERAAAAGGAAPPLIDSDGASSDSNSDHGSDEGLADQRGDSPVRPDLGELHDAAALEAFLA